MKPEIDLLEDYYDLEFKPLWKADFGSLAHSDKENIRKSFGFTGYKIGIANRKFGVAVLESLSLLETSLKNIVKSISKAIMFFLTFKNRVHRSKYKK